MSTVKKIFPALLILLFAALSYGFEELALFIRLGPIMFMLDSYTKWSIILVGLNIVFVFSALLLLYWFQAIDGMKNVSRASLLLTGTAILTYTVTAFLRFRGLQDLVSGNMGRWNQLLCSTNSFLMQGGSLLLWIGLLPILPTLVNIQPKSVVMKKGSPVVITFTLLLAAIGLDYLMLLATDMRYEILLSEGGNFFITFSTMWINALAAFAFAIILILFAWWLCQVARPGRIISAILLILGIALALWAFPVYYGSPIHSAFTSFYRLQLVVCSSNPFLVQAGAAMAVVGLANLFRRTSTYKITLLKSP